MQARNFFSLGNLVKGQFHRLPNPKFASQPSAKFYVDRPAVPVKIPLPPRKAIIDANTHIRPKTPEIQIPPAGSPVQSPVASPVEPFQLQLPPVQQRIIQYERQHGNMQS